MLATEKPVHDVYSLVIGAYVINALWYFQDWAISHSQTYSTQGMPVVDKQAVMVYAKEFAQSFATVVYFAIFLGVLTPLTMGLLAELYMTVPLKTAFGSDNSLILPFVSQDPPFCCRRVYFVLHLLVAPCVTNLSIFFPVLPSANTELGYWIPLYDDLLQNIHSRVPREPPCTELEPCLYRCQCSALGCSIGNQIVVASWIGRLLDWIGRPSCWGLDRYLVDASGG